MNCHTTFATDTATLAIFDPAILQPRANDESNWWCSSDMTDEVRDGRIVVVSLGSDGVYKCRITDGDLTTAEQAYAYDSLLLGLEVVSGIIVTGSGEYLSGTPMQDGVTLSDGPWTCPHPCGVFDAEVFAIAWRDSTEWYVEPGKPVPPEAPADVVVCTRPQSHFAPLSAAPQFSGIAEQWLFPDVPRRVGPEPGMELTTTVLVRGDKLVLKPCGPLSYRPVLPNMDGLAWRDKVRVRVASVDQDAQEMAVALVEKVN
jgi:hypothetical protein